MEFAGSYLPWPPGGACGSGLLRSASSRSWLENGGVSLWYAAPGACLGFCSSRPQAPGSLLRGRRAPRLGREPREPAPWEPRLLLAFSWKARTASETQPQEFGPRHHNLRALGARRGMGVGDSQGRQTLFGEGWGSEMCPWSVATTLSSARTDIRGVACTDCY